MRLSLPALAITITAVCLTLTAPPPPVLDSHHPRAEDVEATYQAQQFTHATAVAFVESDRIFRSLQEAAILDAAYRHSEAVRAAQKRRRAESTPSTGG